jgi:hypothetical protein
MNEQYDNINNFNISNDKYLFFDIFHKDDKLYLICPVYTIDETETFNLIKSINIKYNNELIEPTRVIIKLCYEPTMIIIYDFVSTNIKNTFTVEYQNTIKEYKLYHKITDNEQRQHLGMTTLFKNDYKSIDIFYDYYEKQGYDHYFMYYNGQITNEIDKLYKKPNITLIEWDYPYWNEEGRSLDIHHHAQLGQMHHAIYKYGKNQFEYMAFHDLDEYLYIPQKSIKHFLYETNYDAIGFLNCWAKTVDSSGNDIIPLTMPKTILKNKKPDKFAKRSKAIYKIDDVKLINIHNGHLFNNTDNIRVNIDQILFHIHNWNGRVIDDAEYEQFTFI